MDWGKSLIGMCCGLALACGPAGSAGTDTDTDTDTDGASEGTGAATSDASATDPSMGSMSGSATTTSATTNDTNDTNDTTDPTEDPGSSTEGSTVGATDTDDCPLGSEGCLCDVGAACDDGLDCDDKGICVAPPACRPIDVEPHDDEASAVELDSVGCDEGMELGVIGTIEGPQTDWYVYFGNDAFACAEQPIAIVSAEESLEVCVYLACENGGDVQGLACGGEWAEADSPAGLPGCCGSDVAFVEDYDCSGFGGKDADVFIAVASADEVCVDYALEYGF